MVARAHVFLVSSSCEILLVKVHFIGIVFLLQQLCL
jgi:hypothetical protein